MVLILVLMLSASLAPAASANAATPARAPRSYAGPAATYNTVTFTGNPAADFPSDALLYTNDFTPWGSENNLTGLYGTWNETNLFLAISGIVINGNQLYFAVSNNSATVGTTNLSNLVGVAGVSLWNRTIDFTQPINFLFVVNGTTGAVLAYEVTSAPGSAATTVVAYTPAAVDDTVTYDANTKVASGNLEVDLAVSSVFPTFPDFANVSLYAAIVGGSGPYMGPTIPSGQTYDDTYSSSIPQYQLTSHDLPDGYALENTFYTLGLDPAGLGMPDSGVTPNYVENDTFHTVTFTGVLKNDFAPGEKALINTNTGWSPTNLLNSSYITWNETTLFLGYNLTIQGPNSFSVFISNDTGFGLGTWTLNTTNVTTLNRELVFTRPINFIAQVNYSSSSVPATLSLFEVTSAAATSNTSATVVNVTSRLPEAVTNRQAVEFAIPFSLLYDRPGSWPVIGQFANVSILAAIHSSSGNATGPTIPAGQTSTNSYNHYHTDGIDSLLNTFFTENLDPYGDSLAAPQINPTYTYGHTFHNVHFTGIVTQDFDPLEIVGSNAATPYGTAAVLNATYATWNYTDLFVATDSFVLSGGFGPNYLLVAISNDTGVGATNFSSTNVPALSRNFTFATPINFVFAFTSGQPNGTLYEVNLSATTSTYTKFNDLGNITPAKDGDEFEIPFTTMYPSWASFGYGSGPDEFTPGLTPQIVAMVYGGPGAYIGPTIPTGQSFSQAYAGQYAHIKSYVLLSLDPNYDGFAEPGIVPSSPPVVYAGNPIAVNLIFNDHQPFYAPIGGSYLLPWAVVHLEEYAEQALLAGLYPSVNLTYSLSGSLLYQIKAVADGDYNNSYLEAAWIPATQWGNTIYTEVTTYGDSFLNTFAQPYQWNGTTVAEVLEYDLAFNTPLWVYSEPTNASALYKTLFDLEQAHTALTTAQLTDALVEFFLWSTSYPIVTGQLGSAYIDPTMWAFYNDTGFSIGDLSTIAAYYPIEAQLTLSAFSHDRMTNSGGGGNVELITTPFDHPILPLLLLNNWTDENGAAVTKGVWANDTTAQLQIGSELYDQFFGQAPLGLWSPEQAVSSAEIPFINETGYNWTSSSQATLQETGEVGSDSSPISAAQMEALYTPYKVSNGTQSTVMVFRDDGLSNDWGFNYGSVASSSGNWAAVKLFIDYLKNVYATIPRDDHNKTLVTVALDGENWMFMSPFPEDAVPFISDLYTALEQNSSWLSTNTTQQYLVTHPASTLPTITSLPTGSWNNQPSGSGIDSYLGQWAGHSLQDATWQQLTLVRSEVQAFGTANGLTQPTTLATLQEYNNFPYLTEWNTSTLEGKYVEAWTAIYGAEGSDSYFAFSPDQSPTSQNAVVFEQQIRSELSLALTVLGIPLTPFLKSSYVVPLTPTTWGTNASISPVLSGSLYTSETFPSGVGYSVNHNDAWAGAYVEATGNATAGAGVIAETEYAFDVSNLYFSVEVNGATSAYKSPNFYTAAPDVLDLFFSPVNPGAGDLQSLGVPSSVYTVGGVPFGFAATTEATIEGNSITPTGSATLGLFGSTASETWQSITSIAGNAFVGDLLQVQVPMTDLGMAPGDSIEFFVAAVNGTTGAVLSSSGPMLISVPSSLAKLTLVSVIHNTAVGNGPGAPYAYTYPTAIAAGTTSTPAFPPDSFTIKWVTVSMNPFSVQFNVTFGNLSNVFGAAYGFSQPVIDIYIHEAGVSGGSTAGLPGAWINISSASAWQYAIQATGYSSGSFNAIQTATGVTYPSAVLISSNTGLGSGTNPKVVSNATVSIQVPTSIIGTTISTDSYVIVAGSQDGDSVGGVGDDWRQVDAVASAYQGGGAPTGTLGDWSPNVYSYVAPAVVDEGATLTQQALLSTFNSTHFATLDGITLPLVTTSHVTAAKLGASTIVGSSADPQAYYAVGSQVYSSTSVDGMTWTTPAPLVNLSFVPTGLAAVGGGSPGLLAWNGTSTVFENVTSGKFVNATQSGAVEAGALTYANGGYLDALDIGGTVSVGPPGATAWGTDAVSASAVGLSTANGVTYLAYTSASGLSVVVVTLGTDTATFGTSTVLSAAVPASSTVESLALAAAPTGAVAVVLDLENTSGSNVFLASGTGTVTLKALTDDGQDSSPSVLLAEVDGTWEVYVGFTNSAVGGNVYFLPGAVASVAPSPPPSKAASTPAWEYAVIGGVVALVIILVLVALVMRRRRGGAPPKPAETTATPTPEAPMETSAEGPMGPGGGSGASPPTGGTGT